MPFAKARPPRPAPVSSPSKREQAVLDEGGIRCDSFVYDFDQDGGAVGTISFRRLLPAGAVVTRVFSDEITTLTSGGSATLQVQAGSTDLTDAIAFDTGFAGTENQALASSAEAIKISSESELRMSIATAAVTAGKVRFYVEYLVAND